MFSWLRRIISRTKNFNLLGSVWFSNLDHLVGNIQYLQDDVDKPKQSGIANQSDKPNESEQRVEPSHYCAHHPPEPVIVQDMTALTTTTETPATSVATVKSEATGTTSAPSPASTTTTSGTDKKDAPKAPEVPKVKQ
jgi:hypothetical protein